MGNEELNWEAALIFIGLLIVYFIWGTLYIKKQAARNTTRFNNFEDSLKNKILDYKCFTNNHPYAWNEIAYHIPKYEILGSSKWEFSVGGGAFPTRGDQFSFKVDEEKKFIYIAKGSESFQWDSLCHFDEWEEQRKKRRVIYF